MIVITEISPLSFGFISETDTACMRSRVLLSLNTDDCYFYGLFKPCSARKIYM